MVYAIYEGNMERLSKKINRIANKCNKYGCDFKYNEVGEEFRTIKDENNQDCEVRFVLVEVEGTAKVDDWEYVATIEHEPEGNIINKCNTEIEVPNKYYTTSCICEHCNSKRKRSFTYIIHNAFTDEWKQVGKSCLKDFTCGLSAELVAGWLDGINSLIEGETPYSGCYIERHYDLREILCYAKEVVSKFGYVPSQEIRPTRQRVIDYWKVDNHGWFYSENIRKDFKKEMDNVNFNALKESNKEYVEKALEWVLSQDEWSDYMHNLITICKKNKLTKGHFGILISLIPTYERAMEREIERKKKEELAKLETNSEYVGEIGERILVDVENIKCVTSWETQWGTTLIYKITDKSGNVFTWKTSKWIDDEVVYSTITGTVKEHKEYRDVKQTELTRCKLV